MNVALILPLYFEYARLLRRGVLEWADRHSGWRIIEIDPGSSEALEELEPHLHGAITWDLGNSSAPNFRDLRQIPILDCGSGEKGSSELPGPARVTFERDSINRLALAHFRDLGLEAVGYVGNHLFTDQGRNLVPRVAGMREAARSGGMEWVCHDLEGIDPDGHPHWLWNGHLSQPLVTFLQTAPKPLGLLAEDDYVGTMVCDAAIRLGINIPGEIAVLGQGNRVIGQSGPMPLSSVVLPGNEIGWAAADLLDKWMKGSPPKPWSRLVPCENLAVRRSTGGISLDLGIERAKRHFDRHVLTGVTVQELAAVAGCSAKTLRTRFAGLYGFEVSSAVRERRSEFALKLLAESGVEIGEIARRCGFPSAPNFFNFITRQTGMGPAEYRRQFRSTSPGDHYSL